MSYMSRLDAARQHLVAGDFFEAEQEYWEACSEWESSRVRAPLTEKAIEPALRWGAGLFGRDRSRPALTTFPQREAQLRADLEEVAELLAREAVERAGRDPLADPDDAPVFARTLRLLRASRIFTLSPPDVWPVTRAYLATCRNHDLELDATCLPEALSLDGSGREWLLSWTEAALAAGVVLRPMVAWLAGLLRADGELPARVHGALSRLFLQDALGAPRALEHGRLALASGDPVPDGEDLLRTVAGLALNEGRLTVGSPSPDLWHELGAYADQLGVAWPPRELNELMLAREMTSPCPVAALAWNEGGAASLLVLRHHSLAPCDALALQPSATGEGAPFGLTVAHAREALDRFLDADAALLVGQEPPAWVRSLLGRRPVLRVDALVAGLAPHARPAPPAPPRAPHPIFDPQDALATPWSPLLREASSLPSRLQACLRDEAFVSGWGQQNLRRLADQPVELWRALATCAATFWPGDDATAMPERVQTVTGEIAWQWPVLGDRRWPAGVEADVPAQRPEKDVLFANHPEEVELAGLAAISAPAEVLADGPERAAAVASSAAATLDPTTVTWAPSDARCPQIWLTLLERWMQTAAASVPRAVDVLWLYRALASCPEGDVPRWLGEGGSGAAREEVTARAALEQAGCDESCRLQASPSGCFETQLEERRSYGQVWIEELAQVESALPRAPVLLIDDILPQLAARDDASLVSWLQGIARLASSVRQCLLWCDAGVFTRPMLRQLNADRASDRSWRLAPRDATEELEMYLAPAGYAPGSMLLAEESQELVRARLSMWVDRAPESTAVWRRGRQPVLESEQGVTLVDGVARRSTAQTVVLPSAGEDATLAPLAVLVRLAAAAHHAGRELVCLDARVAALPGLLQGMSPHVKELTPAGKLARSGAEILSERWRRHRSWRHPLTAERLAAFDPSGEAPEASSWEAVADALAELRRGRRLVVGGLAGEERRSAAELVARLAGECGDEGPLGLRSVLWVGDLPGDRMPTENLLRLPHDLPSLEHALLAAERGPATMVVVSPQHLDDAVFCRWAARATDSLWVLPQAERGLTEHPLFDPSQGEVLPRVQRLVAESGAAVLACVDSAAFTPWAARVGARVEAEIVGRSDAVTRDDWRWRRVPLDDPSWACPVCRHEAPLAHRYDVCDRCGSTRVGTAREVAAVREQMLEVTARWLRQRGPHHPWTVVVRDAADRRRLEASLGLDREVAGDLLGARTDDAYLQSVVCPAQLWSASRRAGEIVVVSIPDQQEWLDGVVARLGALGFTPGVVQVLDHPLLWREGGPSGPAEAFASLEAVRLRWTTPRAEVEYRVRETLEGLVPRLRARSRPAMIGLGPVRDPGEDPKLAWLLRALQEWDLAVPSADDGGSLGWTAADAVARASGCIEELVARGLTFGATAFEAVDWPRWDEEVALPAARSFLRWALREGLLEASDLDRPVHHGAAAHSFRQCARVTPAQQDVELPQASAPEEDPVDASVPPVSDPAPHGWILGIAGSGKTHRAIEVVRALAARTDSRILVLVPQATSLLRWQGELERDALRARVDAATVSELGLAFLRHHPDPGGAAQPLRLMPQMRGEEGDHLRAGLLEAASRKYAQVTGHVPPVDWVYLERMLSGSAPYAQAAAAGAAGLDAGLLAECARSARYEAGWITDADLRQLSREWLAEHPYVAGAWRDRYRVVLLEDVDALHPDQLTFVEQMFPQTVRWTTGDPFLVAMPLEAREKAEYRSWRSSKEMARAASELLFVTHGEPATRLRSRDRHKGKVARHHVLNLESCAAFLQSQLAGGKWNGGRVGVVVGHEADLQRLGTRLREAQVRVWPARDLAFACAPGPRQLLALLLLARALGDGKDEDLGPLLRVLLAFEGRPLEEVPTLARALVGSRLGSTAALTSPQACYVQPLVAVARRVLEADTLGQAFDALQRTHFLRAVLDGDATGGRLLDYVEARSTQPWRELLVRIDPAAIADPLAGGDHVWLTSVDQLAGLAFDHLVYLCTGHEPPEQHYRVLGRARESFVVLYSERDPLASPR